jgi:hypothetical protein
MSAPAAAGFHGDARGKNGRFLNRSRKRPDILNPLDWKKLTDLLESDLYVTPVPQQYRHERCRFSWFCP